MQKESVDGKTEKSLLRTIKDNIVLMS